MLTLQEALARPIGGWRPLVDEWVASQAGQRTLSALEAERAAGTVIHPAQVLRALELTPPQSVRVVILGQDPYHGPGQAEGLAFSVPKGVRVPPSLRNIFKELQRDLGLAPPASGSLLRWAAQGVLLLNTTLTVREGAAASHAHLGWGALTDALIRALACDEAPKAFLLWGAHAQAKAGLIAATEAGPHRVWQCNHPSPLSALRPPVPFIGCGHFGLASRFLADCGRGAVDWSLA